jgi:amidophosphoribosyltransferase
MLAELVACNRSTEEIAKYINADAIVFQDLSDMTAACMEAATGESKVQSFEVGLFSGDYVTEVPSGYFEKARGLRGGKRKGSMLITNGATVNIPADKRTTTNGVNKAVHNIPKPDYYQDIRQVV